MKKRIFGLVLAIVLCLEISVPAAATGPTFRDVPADFWAYAQIERAFADGAINGTSHDVQTGERRFSPGGTVTMAQFVTILCRKFFPEQLKASAATGPWYAQAQDVALKNHLYTYTSAGTKGMGKAINRMDMAGVLYATLAAIGCKPTDAETQGVDAQIADYNRIENPTPVVGVVALGIINGVDEQGTFAGERYMSRAQAAAVYCRLVDATAEKQSALRQGASLRFDAPFDAPIPCRWGSGTASLTSTIYMANGPETAGMTVFLPAPTPQWCAWSVPMRSKRWDREERSSPVPLICIMS